MKQIDLILMLTMLAAATTEASEKSVRIDTDLLIVGATESGWAAAIQAARMGVPSITVVHDGRWIGGQFTEQALACVDENKGVGKVGWGVDWHPMKRSFHRSGLFKELMDEIESFNTAKYGHPMPGRPYHGPSTFRPIEAEAIFRKLLQPYIDRGQVRIYFDRYPVAAEVESITPSSAAAGGGPARTRLSGLSFAPVGKQDADLIVRAKITIDASDWGDAIQVSGAEFECGPDPRSRYDEPSAPDDLADNPPNEMNPITWAMIVEQSDRETPVARPARYDDRNFVRASRISLAEMRGLDWDRPVRLGSINHWPDGGSESPRQLSVFTVRRLVDGRTSNTGKTLILLNYMLGQDYPLERLPQHVCEALEATEAGGSQKNIVRMSRQQRQIIFDDARRHALALLYHLQNYVHRRAADTTNSFRSYQLCDDFGTPDRLPPKPYIRESLRLKAMYMMREQDGRNRDGVTKQSARERFAEVMYPDGVLCWQFHYDFHRTGRAYLRSEGTAGPWIDFEKPGRHTHHVSDRSVFPLRSLIPVRMDGLLGAQKNLGYSSIVCAAIRLHDQCVAIGQAAGAAAAVSITNHIDPQQIPYDRESLEQVRHGLCGGAGRGVPLLLWPYRDLATDHRNFIAINRLSAIGVRSGNNEEVDFRPEERATAAWQQEMIALARQATKGNWTLRPQPDLTRGALCQLLWDRVRQVEWVPFPRRRPDDADADGIVDREDPDPFTPGDVVRWKLRPPEPAGPSEDGVPPRLAPGPGIKQFNFTPRGSEPLTGFVNDVGQRYVDEAGHGWHSPMQDNSRRRGVFPDSVADTFLFTRDAATWECTVQRGTWHVTLCVGDASYRQDGARVTVEGTPLVVDAATEAGRFLETTVTVEVTDGRLTIELGPQEPGHNTCVNWVQIRRE